jgi:hypothetical protein
MACKDSVENFREVLFYLYNRDMKDYLLDDTVEFRNGSQHLYGVIVKRTLGEEEKVTYTILAGKLVFHHVAEEDILKDFGREE